MRVQGLWINPEVSTGGLRVEGVERKTRLRGLNEKPDRALTRMFRRDVIPK